MNHEMKLKPIPFDLIKSGEKTIEVRLLDEKRQLIKLGDTITFSKLPELSESLTVVVQELLKYPDFESLFTDFPPENFGAKGWSVKDQSENMYQYYSVDEVKKYGVLAIRIKQLAN